MSGIEVAGLALGALPILFSALDTYKSGITRIKSGLKKREYVKKVARALHLQERSLVVLMESILQQSGCELPLDETQLPIILNQQPTKELVDDYLGPENALVLMETLDSCLSNLQRAIRKIAELVPTLKVSPAIQKILDANSAAEKGRVDFLARMSIIVNFNDFKKDIDDLDKDTNALDRFANSVTRHRTLEQSAPSRKAAKLAHSLKVVRENLESLHSVLVDYWPDSCHNTHELKLFLDDRVSQKSQSHIRKAENNSFRVVFSGDFFEPSALWYETAIIPSYDEDHDVATTKPTKVQILAPPSQSDAPAKKNIDGICLEIQSAAQSKLHPVFHLSGGDKMMVSHQSGCPFMQSEKAESVTLKDVLDSAASSVRPFPWKSRMVLALKLASSFLQFLRTPWVRTCWSANDVQFLSNGSNLQVSDLSQPYLSHEFSQPSSVTSRNQTQIKSDLIELGILLLEVWHETTFEAQFPDQSAASRDPYIRHACALKWLDDVQNPPPDLYFKAICHCIAPVQPNEPRASEWDNIQLWKSICENVIDPLLKVAQI